MLIPCNQAIPLAALVFVLASMGSSGNAVELAAKPVVNRDADAQMALSGPVQRYIEAVSTNWLLRAPRDNPAMLQMLAERDRPPYRNLLPWSGEFAGKYLTGTVQVLRTSENAKLRAATERFVHDLLDCQESDGYLGPFPRKYRLTGKAPNTGSDAEPGDTWDLWNHYHALVGLLLWHEYANDSKALAAACRIGDLMCEKFLDAGAPVSSTGSFEMNQAIAHGMALLYRRAGEQKYLELAERTVEDFQAPGAGDYLRMGLNKVEFYQTPKPRWESLHPIMGLAELYQITGNRQYREAFEHLWWSVAKLDRHNNGGFSSGEQAQGNPYHPGAIETCCTIAWMAMSVEMLRMTGDPIVADELELSTLNQVVGSYSPTGRWSTYNTPMNGRRIPSTQDIAFQIRPGSEELNCCSVNAARGFGMISDWALMRDEDGLVLNWYGPSEFETTVGGVSVKLREETDYPRTGNITLHVSPCQTARFSLKLRIPHWSKQSRVALNGEELAVKPGAYAAIDRRWEAGEVVTIQLDMTARYWVGERECAGKTSVYRGPVLLTFEEAKSSNAAEFAGPNGPPTFDVRDIERGQLAETPADAIVVLNVQDASGKTHALRDFGTAGYEAPYLTWLKIDGAPAAPFSKQNPSRTARAAVAE
ncbi:MAG: glycoside hydrolase family 127 protein [Pirellulales bacterium]|nr:glycoside hydrolase family 127 protein [Pirellulales bacterium]